MAILKISGTDWLEVPYHKAYVLGLCKGISPENMALYGKVAPLMAKNGWFGVLECSTFWLVDD